MAEYVAAPPIERLLPVTKGCDRAFTVQRVDTDGDPVNYQAGTTVYMWIDIDRDNPTKVDAVVNGPNALLTIESTVADQVRTGTRWRVVVDYGSLELPLIVGRFERRDG